MLNHNINFIKSIKKTIINEYRRFSKKKLI